MNAKWTSLIVGGVILAVLSTQVMAQPWGGGPGYGRGRGMGMGMRGQGPGCMMMGPGMGMGMGMGAQGGPGAWCPFGAGLGGGRAGWNGPGPAQFGFGPGVARRLGLTDNQVEKIRNIVQENRSKTLAAIKEVLTDEQAAQLEQMRLQGGRGAGRGMGRRGWMNAPDASTQPPADGQDANAVPSVNRPVPPIERMFDQADTNHDGALTKEEIRAFHENMGPRPGRQQQ